MTTDAPTLRDRAIDAVKQAISTLGMWLPPAGREAAVDAVLALTSTNDCCVISADPRAFTTALDTAESALQNFRAGGEQIRAALVSPKTPERAAWAWDGRHGPTPEETKAASRGSSGLDMHLCNPGASVYYCPTSGRAESTCHSGFDTCCGQPELHRPPTNAEILGHADDGEWHDVSSGPVEPSDPAQCSGEEGFCLERGFHRHSLKQPADGQSALDLIRASAELREAKADDEHDAGRHCSSNEHAAIAAGLRIAEAHLVANPDAELDASQGRAVRIQQLLDEQRDKARKDAAASRESERQLQQQIDRQAKEIDRLRDDLAALHAGEEELTDERIVPTPAQWIWQWNRATLEQRLDMAGRIQQAFDTASRCFSEAHVSQAAAGRTAMAAVGRIHTLADELDAAEAHGSLADGYYEGARRIREALEETKGEA